MKTIYGLSDPETHELCYIGQTSNLERRWVQHVSSPGNLKNGNVFLTKWITDLAELGLKPVIKALAKVEDWMAFPTETAAIRQAIQDGHPLLNQGRYWSKLARLRSAQWYQQRNTSQRWGCPGG